MTLETLGQKQRFFSRALADLLYYIYSEGYEVTFGDVWAHDGHRPHSNHYQRLAADLNLFKDGVWLTSTKDHAAFGAYWKKLHPLCRWGGDWGDGNHYSIEHEGRS